MVKKSTFSANFVDFWASDVDFQPFLVPKQVPGGYIFGVSLKTVSLSKSCSRCGGSTIFKGQALQKSVRRATLNVTGKKKWQKSFPAPSPDVLFRSRARFWSILGSRPEPKMELKPCPEKSTTSVGVSKNWFFAFLSLRRVPGPVPETPGTLPDQILLQFCGTFPPISSGSCRVFSGSAGMLPGSASNLGNPLWSREAIWMGTHCSTFTLYDSCFCVNPIRSSVRSWVGVRMY